MNNKGSKLIITDRLELRPQTINEQNYLWKILMNPEVNKFYLTVPIKFREKLKDWSLQEKYYEESIKHARCKYIYMEYIFKKYRNMHW